MSEKKGNIVTDLIAQILRERGVSINTYNEKRKKGVHIGEQDKIEKSSLPRGRDVRDEGKQPAKQHSE